MVLGVKTGVIFQEVELVLSPGDRLLLYTDGIVEARNETGEFYGVKRLCRLFSSRRGHSPQAMVDAILTEIRAFSAEAVNEDDVALIVVEVT